MDFSKLCLVITWFEVIELDHEKSQNQNTLLDHLIKQRLSLKSKSLSLISSTFKHKISGRFLAISIDGLTINPSKPTYHLPLKHKCVY